MAELSPGQRIDRLERVVEILAEDQLKLQELVTELATATRRGFDDAREADDRIRAEMREAEERRRAADEKIRAEFREEMRERARYYDDRVDKLVLGIAEYLRRQDESRN